MRNAGREMVRWLFLLLALVAIALGMGAAVGVVSAGPECDCPPCEAPEGETAPPGYGEREFRESAGTGTARAREASGCDPTELAALQREIDALRGRKDGVPLSWPAHIPEQWMESTTRCRWTRRISIWWSRTRCAAGRRSRRAGRRCAWRIDGVPFAGSGYAGPRPVPRTEVGWKEQAMADSPPKLAFSWVPGREPAIVFIHGLGADGRCFLGALDAPGLKGRALLVPDLAG